MAGSGTYETRTEGGYGTLLLDMDESGRLRGSFEGQYCFRDTPGTNCFRLYRGELDVVDLATGIAPPEPDVDYGVPGDFPALSSATRANAVWRLDGSELVEGRQRSPLTTFEGQHEVVFKVAPRPEDDGYRLFLVLTSLEPGEQILGELAPRVDLGRPFEIMLYTSQADGGGTITVSGRNERAIWGLFEARICYGRIPGSNCYELSDGRFSAALE